MKTLIITTLSLLFVISEAQTIEKFKYLDINNVKISLSSSGDFARFWNTTQSQIPIGENKSCGYEQGMWINATTNNGEELESLNPIPFNRGFLPNFYRGPISTKANSDFFNKYNRVWKISKAEIEYHKNNFSQTEYITPKDILEWPAHGDETNGEAKNLAPFVDLNSNGLYEPVLGDYPKIRGDQALYVIINDKNGSINNPAVSKLNLEMHIMLYGYSRFNYSFAENTYFLHYEIYNRSNTNYLKEFNIAHISIMQLGYHLDDFMGTDVDQDMVFTYNGDNFDDNNYGYGLNPPAFGFKLLNNPIYSSYNPKYTQNALDGYPNSKSDRKHNMEGQYRNGNLQHYGYFPGTTQFITSKFAYPGTTDPILTKNLTEIKRGNTPGRRLNVITTRFHDIAPGESICVDYAGIFARGPGLNNFEQVNYLKDQASGVQNLYNASNSKCSEPLSVTEIEKVKKYSFYFNYNKLYIERPNASSINNKIELINALGQVVLTDNFTSNETQHSIGIQNIKTGTYFIRIQNETMKISIP